MAKARKAALNFIAKVVGGVVSAKVGATKDGGVWGIKRKTQVT